MSEMLTKHFSAQEMACRCGECNARMDLNFMARVEVYRHHWKRPMKVTSGARCPAHNVAIGGSENSRHLWIPSGRDSDAVDFYVNNSRDRHDAVQMAMGLGFFGIGVGKNFIHIDGRPAKSRCLWEYS